MMTIVAIAVLGAFMAGLAAMVASSLKSAAPDEALVVTTPGIRKVSFTSTIVMPVVHTLDRVSLREHAVTLDRRGDAALRTADDQLVELVVTFQVRVSRTPDDVLRALAAMGPRTGDGEAVRARFSPAFTQALEVVARGLEAGAIDREREAFTDRLIERLGADLDGFSLADVAVTGVRVLPASPYRG